MAKFQVKAAHIALMTTHGYIDGSGYMTIRAPVRAGGTEKRYSVTFLAASEAIQTSNPRAIRALENMSTPCKKINGVYICGDPATTKLFDKLLDSDPITSYILDVDGTEVLKQNERQLLRKWNRKTGNIYPSTLSSKATLSTYITNAKNYFNLT